MTSASPFPDPLAPGAFLLPGLVVVDATGADAATFLQGQFTNDVIGAGAGRACLSGYCTPKGRLLALPLVLALPDGALRLLVPREIVESLLKRLRMFVMRAAVTFERRDDLHCLGAHVPDADAAAALAQAVPGFPAVPFDALEVMNGESGSAVVQVCRWHDAFLPMPCRRYLIVATTTELARDDADGDTSWRHGDITAGVPRIGEATQEAFVPQMVNLQLVEGLSFRKGCYPGQEIVARMQYLGTLKRHMRRFVVSDPDNGANGDARVGGDGVVAGATLVTEADADAGRVVDAVRTYDGIELLAVVKIGADIAALRIGNAVLESRALPYTLPADAQADAAADAQADAEADAAADAPANGRANGRADAPADGPAMPADARETDDDEKTA